MWQNKSLEMAYVCETCTSNGVLKATRYSICVLHINSQLEQSNINGGRSVVSSVETIINRNNCFGIKQFLFLVDFLACEQTEIELFLLKDKVLIS